MPIDSNIALSFKPSVGLADPMQQYGQAQQIQANAMAMRQARSENALAQQKAMADQNKALEDQAVNKLIAQHFDPATGRVNMGKVMEGAAKLGLGGRLPGMQAQAQEFDAKDESTRKEFLGNVMSSMDVAKNLLVGVTTPEQAKQFVGQIHSDPTLKRYFAEHNVTPDQALAQIDAVANDPPAFAALLQKMQLGLDGAQKAVEAQANRDMQITRERMIGERMAANRLGRPAAPAKAVTSGAMPAAGSSAQSDAAVLAQAVSEGRLDPNRINSRSAPMLAATLRAAPGVNLVDVHATANTKSSPAIQARLAAFNSLPDVIASVAEAGKKVGLSNFTPIGAVQVGAKMATNDPDFRTYLTKRNDAVQAIAYAMRGVGMSDKATQLEEQGAPVNMSPRAFDAWAKGQMDIIKARQKQNAPFEVNRKGAASSGRPSLDDIFKAKK